MKRMLPLAAIALVAVASGLAQADEFQGEIDLTTFGEERAVAESVWDEAPIQEVAQRLRESKRRFYLSAMIGPSMATMAAEGPSFLITNYDTQDTLLAAGGAMGVAIQRHRGQLRLEVEGMGRDTFTGPAGGSSAVPVTLAQSNWSVMTNAWRDFMVTDRFGIYGGGGLGLAGYQFGYQLFGLDRYGSPQTDFAWQFGGGLIYELTNRLTFDVGYRYYQVDKLENTLQPFLTHQFAASELMFTLRFYEPFRGLRR